MAPPSTKFDAAQGKIDEVQKRVAATLIGLHPEYGPIYPSQVKMVLIENIEQTVKRPPKLSPLT